MLARALCVLAVAIAVASVGCGNAGTGAAPMTSEMTRADELFKSGDYEEAGAVS